MRIISLFCRNSQRTALSRCLQLSSHNFTTDPLEEPAAGGLPKNYPKHVEDIVDSISKLNLLEVSSLNSLLKVSKYIFLCGKL